MIATKRCNHCRETKPVYDFGNNKDAPDGYKYTCRSCDAAIHRNRYPYNAEVLRARTKINRENYKRKRQCVNCGKPLGEREGRKYCQPCSEIANLAQKNRRERHRQACLAAYGGAKCACCGEREMRFLTLDHPNSDGRLHRRKLLNLKPGMKSGAWGSAAFYFALVKAGFPPGLRVLCFNCNCGRHHNGGICPHEEKRLAAVAQ